MKKEVFEREWEENKKYVKEGMCYVIFMENGDLIYADEYNAIPRNDNVTLIYNKYIIAKVYYDNIKRVAVNVDKLKLKKGD